MISEVENIKKGLVVSTVEYDTSKKIIGVATTNLSPGPNGIAPLEKQGAFQVQNTAETIDFAQALNNAQAATNDQIAEQIELPVLGAQTESNGLKAPVTSDVISENPVQVENPSKLTGFDIPDIEAVQEEEKVEETAQPVALDIQMPEMPDVVVATEPTGTNESLFEGAQPQETTSILEETAPAATETAQPQETLQQEATQVNIEMPSMPSETAAETQPATVAENIMGEIPTTAPAEEIPTFDIEMPAIGEVAKTEVMETIPEQTTQQTAEETQAVVSEPAPVVEQTQEILSETPAVTEESKVEKVDNTSNVMPDIAEETNADEVLKAYKESMEAIISNFNKAQLDLLNECVEALRKMQSVKKEKVEQVPEQQPVQETTQVAVQQQPTQQALTPGNPLESAAFEIIDAMSAPKM